MLYGVLNTDHSNASAERNVPTAPVTYEVTVGIVLTQHGGQAGCALAIRGHRVQSATASGAFGRATCTGELPSPPPSAS